MVVVGVTFVPRVDWRSNPSLSVTVTSSHNSCVELPTTLVTGRFESSAVRLTSVLTLLMGGWLIVMTVVVGFEGGLLMVVVMEWPDC